MYGFRAATHIDRLGRAVRTATQGFDGRWIHRDTEYDGQGRVAAVSRPYYAGATAYRATAQYDVLGRVHKVFEPDNPSTAALTVAYDGLTRVRTDILGHGVTETRDALRRVATVTNALGQATAYEYDPFGNLLGTTDPAGNRILNAYDIRGRKTQTIDPDMGTWVYEHDALSQLVRQTDARSQVTALAYDKLGRLVQRTEPGLASTWAWDTAPTAGKGRLHTASGGGYLRTHLYDQKGRPFTTVVAVDGIEMGQMTEYDAAGRIQAQYFTTGQGTRHAYTATGYAHELRDTATNALYWQALDVDAEGHVTREAYGNGVTTTRAYLPQNGRLVTQDARNALNQPVQYNFYGYDLAGNVTLRWDEGGGSGSGDVLAYDALHRLTRVENDTNGVQTLTEVAYDVLGNIAAKDGVGAYLYGGNPGCAPGSGAGPHAVCRAGSEAYAYDANGNLTSGGGRTISWTAWNMPESITQAGQATTWSYDPEHRRVKMTAPDRTTWYFNPGIHQGGHYQRTRYAGGAVEHRHTLYGGGYPIGEVITFDSAAPPSVRYFHGDRQGSVMAVTTGSATLLSKYRYDPWGRRSIVTGAASGLLATRQGHTGHEMLEIGLTHMNARLYDPVLARFISADPLVQAPYDLQSLNRYGYVFNNPLAHTDPSGYQSTPDENLTRFGTINVTASRLPGFSQNNGTNSTLWGSGMGGGFSGLVFSFQAFAQRMDDILPAIHLGTLRTINVTAPRDTYPTVDSLRKSLEGEDKFMIYIRGLEFYDDMLLPFMIRHRLLEYFNLGVYHAGVVYLDPKGNPVSMGFFPDGVRPDLRFDNDHIKGFLFSEPFQGPPDLHNYLRSMEGFEAGDYTFWHNNCQAYCAAIPRLGP